MGASEHMVTDLLLMALLADLLYCFWHGLGVGRWC